jgi:hypothetical protein
MNKIQQKCKQNPENQKLEEEFTALKGISRIHFSLQQGINANFLIKKINLFLLYCHYIPLFFSVFLLFINYSTGTHS